MRQFNHSSRFFELMQAGYIQKSLCSICRPRQWPTIQTKDFTDDGYLVYGANGIIGRYSEYNHEDRTILMACRGASCGAINISEPRSYITGNAMCLDEMSDEIYFDFLAYYLSCYDYSQIITGGAQPQITYTSLTKVLVPIPDMAVQNSFVVVLQQADKSKFSDFKSRFIEMFGNPMDSQEMGTFCVGDLCSIISGFPFKSELFNEDNVGKPLIRIRDVGRGYTETYTTEESDSQFIVKTGDLLVGMDGNFEISAWKSDEALLNQRVCMITPKDERITRNYIIYAVQPVLTAIEEKTNATTVKHISASQISSIRFPRVDEVRVAEFDKVVQQADKSKYLN